MKFRVDEDGFDELQPWFVGQMVEGVRAHLKSAGHSGEKLKELCGDLVFDVCAQLDGSARFSVEGQAYTPILAFAESEQTEMAIYPGGSPYLHEYVFGVVDEVFEEEEEA